MISRYLSFLIIVFLSIIVSSCGPSRFVEPLKKGESAISASFGGPLAKIPGVATLPIPFTSIGYGRGISSNITVFGNWYSTASIFGVAQLDAGATIRLIEGPKQKHGLSVTPAFNTAMDFYDNQFKLWPQFDANYYWRYNNRQQVQDDLLTKGGKPKSNLLYVGIGSWYELEGTRAHDEKQNTRVIPMLNLGHDLNWNKWTFKSELKLIAPFSSNQDIVVDYVSLTGDRGATGFYIGFTRRF